MTQNTDKKIFISPSILSADFSRVGEDAELMQRLGSDMLHCDVMDGHFVPNITFGPKFIKDLKKRTTLPLDVHLMISDPEKYIADFVDCGADCITFHIEAVPSPEGLLKRIKSCGVKCGLALSPDTPIKNIEKYIVMSDIILLMSVYPGFGGQSFVENAYSRLKELSEIITKNNFRTLLGIDGGVTLENVGRIKACGAKVIVAGNTIFTAADRKAVIDRLRG